MPCFMQSNMVHLFIVIFFVGLVARGVAADFVVMPEADVSAFRRVGNLVERAQHAHLRLDFHPEAELRVLTHLLNQTSTLATNSSLWLWKPFLAELQSLLEEWRAFGKKVDGLEPFHNAKSDRVPRQIAAAVVGGAVVAGTTWVVAETHALKARMSSLEGNMKSLTASFTSLLHLEKGMLSDIGTLKNATNNLSNKVGEVEEFVAEYSVAQRITGRLRQRLQGLRGLLQHQLVPGLVLDEQLNQGFDQLRRRVRAAGYSVLKDNVLQLYSEEVSYFVDGDAISMVIHIPVIPITSAGAKLYQHLALPISLNSSASATLVSGEGEFLAVFEQDHTFVELSVQDLTACERRGQDFYCPASFPRYRGGGSSCLSALFTHNLVVAKKVCRTMTLQQELQVFRLNATAVVVAVQGPDRSASVRCGKDPTEQRVKLAGVSVVVVGESCQLESEEFVFSGSTSHLPEDLHVVVEGPNLRALAQAEEGIKHLRERKVAVKINDTEQVHELNKISEEVNKVSSEESSVNWWSELEELMPSEWRWVLSLSASGVASGLLLWLLRRCVSNAHAHSRHLLATLVSQLLIGRVPAASVEAGTSTPAAGPASAPPAQRETSCVPNISVSVQNECAPVQCAPKEEELGSGASAGAQLLRASFRKIKTKTKAAREEEEVNEEDNNNNAIAFVLVN